MQSCTQRKMWAYEGVYEATTTQQSANGALKKAGRIKWNQVQPQWNFDNTKMNCCHSETMTNTVFALQDSLNRNDTKLWRLRASDNLLQCNTEMWLCLTKCHAGQHWHPFLTRTHSCVLSLKPYGSHIKHIPTYSYGRKATLPTIYSPCRRQTPVHL